MIITFFFFQAEDGIRDIGVTGVQTCALPILGLPDVWWFRPDGRRMTTPDWNRPDAHVLGVFLNGDGLQERSPTGETLRDDSFLLLFNAHHEDVDFLLPQRRYGKRWVVELTTADKEERQRGREQDARGPVAVMARSLLLLRRMA